MTKCPYCSEIIDYKELIITKKIVIENRRYTAVTCPHCDALLALNSP